MGNRYRERRTGDHDEIERAKREPRAPGRSRAPARQVGREEAPAGEAAAIAAFGAGSAAARLPHFDAIQRSFGRHDLSTVRAGVGGDAAAAAEALGAHAFASGEAVGFAGSPDLRRAAHEAAHVVQQRQGWLPAGGVGRAGDEHERRADEVAAQVVAGRSAEALLDRSGGGGGGRALQLDTRAQGEQARTLLLDVVARIRSARDRGAATRAGDAVAQAMEGTAPVVRIRLEYGGERYDLSVARSAAERSRHELGAVAGEREEGGEHEGGEHEGGEHEGGEHEGGEHEGGERPRARETHTTGTRTQAVDARAMATRLRDSLQRRRDALATLERTADPGHRAALADERAELDRDIATLGDVRPDSPPDEVQAIAARHAERVATRQRTVAADQHVTSDRSGDGALVRNTIDRQVRQIEDGTQRIERERELRADLAEGAVQGARTQRTVTENGEGRSENSRTDTARLGVEDGAAMATLRSESRSASEREGEGERERRSTDELSGGIVHGEHGTGARGRLRTERERTENGTTRSSSDSMTGEVTDRRVALSGEHEEGVRRGNLSGRVRTAADGSFTIEVEPMEDGSGRYRLTFHIHVGASASVTGARGGEHSRVNASATLRGGVHGDVVSTHVLDEAEVQRYLGAADRANQGEEVRDPEEFGRIARLRAGADNIDTVARSTAAVSDPDAATAMRDGESQRVELTGQLGGEGRVGAQGRGFGASLEGGRNEEWTRTVEVERVTVDGRPRVRLTVSFEHASDWHGGGSVTAMSATAGARHAEGQSHGEVIGVELDPDAGDYDAVYRRVVSANSPDALRSVAAAADVRDHVRDRTTRSGATRGTGYDVGGGGAQLGVTEGSGHTDEVDTRDGQRSAHLTGYSERRGTLGGEDNHLLSDNTRTEVDARVGPDETEVDVRESDTHNDPLRAVGEGARAVRDADAGERARMALGGSPLDRLHQAFAQEYSHLHGYVLHREDLDAIVQRSADAQSWGDCACGFEVRPPWEALRRALRRVANPADRGALDPQWAQVDAAEARQLYIAQQIRHFVESVSPEDGAACTRHLFQHWGESSRSLHESTERRLGGEYEWPEALADAHARYDRLTERIRGLGGELGRFRGQPEGEAHAREIVEEIHHGLDAVSSAVQQSRDFREESARSGLVRSISEQRTLAYRALDELHRPAGAATGEPARAGEEGAGDAPARRDAEATARSLRRVLAVNHQRERELLVHAGQTIGSWSEALNLEDPAEVCRNVHELHRTWIQQVVDLRAALRAAGTPEAQWGISTGPGAPRNYELEPNVGWLIQVYQRAMSAQPAWERGIDDTQTLIAQWREQGRY